MAQLWTYIEGPVSFAEMVDYVETIMHENYEGFSYREQASSIVMSHIVEGGSVPKEELEWVEEAKELVRRYIANSYTLTPDAELDYDLVVRYTFVRKTVKQVLFQASINDFRYRVTFEEISPGHTESEIERFETGPVKMEF